MNTPSSRRQSTPQVPPQYAVPLPDFAHIRRRWEPRYGRYIANLLPGEYYVTWQDEMIVTVLGSCISACIRDPAGDIGGMNHFMLPIDSQDTEKSWQQGSVGTEARYGHYAMELLINSILKHGGSRHRLEVKIFGGGRILAQMTDIGQRNIAFIREYIRVEGLKLLAEDVGDRYPRKIAYFPASGRVKMRKLRALHAETIMQQETQYLGALRKPTAGDIEIF